MNLSNLSYERENENPPFCFDLSFLTEFDTPVGCVTLLMGVSIMGWWKSIFWGVLSLTVPAISLAGKGPTIDVRSGIFEPVPIAFPRADGAFEALIEVVASDLAHSGFFDVRKSCGTQSIQEAYNAPSFWEWRSKVGSFLVGATIVQDEPGLAVQVRLFDVDGQRLVMEERFCVPAEQWRLLAHKIANALYKRITGEPGYFDTHIVFTAQYGSPKDKKRVVAVMDQDGGNCRALTKPGRMTLTPKFSPDGAHVAFVAYHGHKAQIHIMNMATKEETVLPTSGVGISPQFSKDGRNLVFCLAKRGTTSVYSYDIQSRTLSRLTQTHGAIDVSPSFSPDGRFMVFASDRGGGRPQLYIMPACGGVPRRLTSSGGSYHAPTWSPDGKWIAFSLSKGGQYYLGVISPEGGGQRLLAEDHVIEMPTWAPDSRHIAFAAQSGYFGPYSLFSVSITGRALRKIPTRFGDTDEGNGSRIEGNHPNWGTIASECAR